MCIVLVSYRADKSSAVTKDALRTPSNLLLIHRSLGVVTNQFNLIGRDLLLVTINSIILSGIIMCNVVLIRFHSFLTQEAVVFLSLVTTSILGTTYLVLSHQKLGEINTGSVKYLASWKNYLEGLNANDRNLMKKYLNSCRPLRLKLGNFGYYQNQQTIKMISRIIVYTAKIVISSKRSF
jgi:hypothetical protein